MSIQTQFTELRENPPNFITVNLRNKNIKQWIACITGPEETPFEGGIFILHIDFPNKYPTKAPNFTMITPIYHPNISESGYICFSMLGDRHSQKFQPHPHQTARVRVQVTTI